MKKKLMNYFSLSEKGAHNIINAAQMSFLKFFSFMLPPMLVFYFLQNVLDGNVKSMAFYMIILVVIAIAMWVILEKDYRKTYDATFEESVVLRVDLANKIKTLPLSYFSTHNLSDLSQTIMMDVNNIEMAISHSIPAGLGFLFFFILITVILIVTSPIMGLCVTLPIWLAALSMFLTKKVQRRNVTKYYERLLENSNAFQEAFEMQQEIKSYSLQEEVRKEVTEKLENTEKIHIVAEFIMAFLSSLIGILPYVAPVLVAIIGAKLYVGGEINILYYTGFLMAATTISHQYTGVQEFILMVFFFDDSFNHVKELKNEPIQGGADKNIDNYDIVLNNVTFRYKDANVINGISFVAPNGKITAIVGPSGCGKTTIMRLISRLYDYDQGKISIGGEDIKGISTKSLYDKVSIVFQNVELFNCSIMENIRMGRKDATDDEVIEAAKLAKVDEIIESLPEGYKTQIGENGSKLSGGERQRISIARAFLKNAPIILLDEISASLDVENEMEIQNSINELIQDKTVIIISHRLKSIENADKIIVMDEGKIDAEGTHDELLEKSTLYKSMIGKSALTENFIY